MVSAQSALLTGAPLPHGTDSFLLRLRYKNKGHACMCCCVVFNFILYFRKLIGVDTVISKVLTFSILNGTEMSISLSLAMSVLTATNCRNLGSLASACVISSLSS